MIIVFLFLNVVLFDVSLCSCRGIAVNGFVMVVVSFFFLDSISSTRELELEVVVFCID